MRRLQHFVWLLLWLYCTSHLYLLFLIKCTHPHTICSQTKQGDHPGQMKRWTSRKEEVASPTDSRSRGRTNYNHINDLLSQQGHLPLLWKENKLNNKAGHWHSLPFSLLHQITCCMSGRGMFLNSAGSEMQKHFKNKVPFPAGMMIAIWICRWTRKKGSLICWPNMVIPTQEETHLWTSSCITHTINNKRIYREKGLSRTAYKRHW